MQVSSHKQTMDSPQGAAAEELLRVEQVRFGYGDEVVVDGVSGRLQAGRVCCLIGPNAAGKTTLLRLMLGQLEPWAGAVRLCGEAVHELGGTSTGAVGELRAAAGERGVCVYGAPGGGNGAVRRGDGRGRGGCGLERV